MRPLTLQIGNLDLGEAKEVVEGVVGENAADKIGNVVKRILDLLAHPLARGLITILVVLIIAKIVLTTLRGAVRRMKLDETLVHFIDSVGHIIVYALVVLTIAGSLGFDVTSLVALLSVVGAAFALAAQNTLSNFFAGIMLLIVHPFRVGDFVVCSEAEGTVTKIGLMNTKFRTIDNRIVVVPNSILATSTVINCSAGGKRRIDLKFTVSYDCDMDKVKAVMLRVLEECPLVLKGEDSPEPLFAQVTEFGESSVVYTSRFWVLGTDYWPAQYEVLESTKRAFDKAGIEIPYNHLNVHMMSK